MLILLCGWPVVPATLPYISYSLMIDNFCLLAYLFLGVVHIVFLRGGAIQGGRNDQTRPEEKVSSGELGSLRLYDESFEKLGYLSNFWNFKIDFFLAKTQLYHYLLHGGCV